jgi:ABC-type antimicrobial peptide transport system permease subunit
MKGTAYVPYTAQATLEDGRIPAEMTIVIRTAFDDPEAGRQLRNALLTSNSTVPVTELRTMRSVVSAAASTPASTAFLFVAFAGVALILGVVGLYGVLSFLVSRRRREMGVRMALGAQRSDILLLVIREGAGFSLFGIALGLAGSLFATRLLATQLYGISSTDSITYVSVAALVALVTLGACMIPARRAAKVDPVVALRFE